MSSIAGLPNLRIVLNDQPLDHALERSLTGLRVRQCLSLPTQLELTFSVTPNVGAADAGVTPGATISVGALRGGDLFRGQVTAITQEFRGSECQLRIRGYDLLHHLRKSQSLRQFADLDTASLARELVHDLGIDVVVSAPELPSWRRRVQSRQSDFDLLTEAAEASGLWFTLRAHELFLVDARGTGEQLELSLGRDLLEARFEVNADPLCRSVVSRCWDPTEVRAHTASATEPRSGRSNATPIQGERLSRAPRRELSNRLIRNASEATFLAQAELDRRVLSEFTVHGIAEGNPALRPGTAIVVDGVQGDFRGRHVLATVTHSVDTESGYVSEFSTEPTPSRRPHTSTATSWGIVTDVEDPGGKARVRVRLPAYGDIETEFLSLLVPGAGPHHGILAVPDIGTNVLVLFPDGDPAHGIVLGGMFGEHEAPEEAGIHDGRVRRYTIRTPGGQHVLLDDEDETVRISNTDGSGIELGPKGVRLYASTDLTIEAPGQTISIRAAKVRFQKA